MVARLLMKKKIWQQMEPFLSLLAVDLAEPGGRWRWGRGEQRGAHFPSPPVSIFPEPPAPAAQLPAGSGCTHSAAAGRKIQGIFQVAFKYPQDHKVFGGFLWGRSHSFLNSWFSRELLQVEKADLIYSSIIQLLLPNQTINTAWGSGVHLLRNETDNRSS